ncbi:MAG: ATP-binding protein [Firmicutes bacterium]|nr:ATP-binding protein [Bacillota bacterium]
MIGGRIAVAYVVKIDGSEVLLNLCESHRGQVAGHLEGISQIGQPGDLLGASAGNELIVLRIQSIEFAEPREAHILGVGTPSLKAEPLRQVRAHALGYIHRSNGKIEFIPEEWRTPALGAEVFPLSTEEIMSILSPKDKGKKIKIGTEARGTSLSIDVSLDSFLSRDVAVLGATGQGKTHFIAGIVQQMLDLPKARIVIFDVNGEYGPAFENFSNKCIKYTILGNNTGRVQNGAQLLRIPYYALGRNGLCRLLIPSERAQLPALRFAIEHLQYVAADANGAHLVDQANHVLFDDCRREGAEEAYKAMNKIRSGTATVAKFWPHMRALSCLAAEWYCLGGPDRNGNYERSSFHYSSVQPLVNRIRGFIEDEQFKKIINVEGGIPKKEGQLDWYYESSIIVEEIFGTAKGDDGWQVHIVDLSQLVQDLMPFVLGALLELYASELFRRGPGGTHPTLLILEEAHHYLRELPGDAEGRNQVLAYERLAKEGRKYHLSLLVSTQRPSELSSTVLAQCGTWCVFRLTNDNDQRAVSSASESSFGYVLRQIPGLPRGQAIILGNAVPFPCRINVVSAVPQPRSLDANFSVAWGGSEELN